MNLAELKPLDFCGGLEEIEGQAITLRRAARSNALCGMTGTLAMFSGVVLSAFAALGLAASFANPVLSIVILFGTFSVGCGGSYAAGMRYFNPSARKLLPYRFEPQAKKFFLANVDRRERLLGEVEAFNDAVYTFKALPARTGVDEIDRDVIENLALRRAGLEAETAAYLQDFERATVDDRARVRELDRPHKKKLPHPDTQLLNEFSLKVRRLREFERAIQRLSGPIEDRVTVDVSPFVAALKLRDELEAERARLVALGLKPKRLPKPRIAARKLLPSAT